MLTSPLFFWLFLAVMIIGTPVVFALAFGPVVQFLMTGNPSFYKMIPQRIFSGIDLFPLLAIPLFILAGELMNVGGITARLVRIANAVVGHLRGGLGHVNIVTNMLMAGVSGSAVADASAIGSILIPAMEKQGYPQVYGAAVTSAAAVIGPIIPPSIIMVIYGFAMNVNVAALFLAGIIPGILLGGGLMVVNWLIAGRRGYQQSTKMASFKEMRAAFAGAFLPMLTPIIIIGGIMTGVFTPTESAAVAAAYAAFLGLVVLRTLKLSDMPKILYRSGVASGTILLIIGCAQLFGWLATISGIPKLAGAYVVTLTDSGIVYMLLVQCILFIAGMFLDAVPSILILGPILQPAATALGIDTLHFALVMCVNLTIGLATPPMGMILFVVAGMTKLGIEAVSKEMIPFFGVHITVILLITFFPALVVTIPRYFGF